MADELPTSAPVKISELADALEFVSVCEGYGSQAYICIPTGQIHYISDGIDPADADNPDDMAESDDYVAVPHKRILDLGSRLVFAFAEEVMPAHYNTVGEIFRRKGAYRRFKDFLDNEGMLEAWYQFETKATEQALRAWCEENDITVADE